MAKQVRRDVRERFGAAVRRLRDRLDISQEELAHRAGIHRTYIGDIERGARNPGLVNICRLAAALGVKASELFAQMEP